MTQVIENWTDMEGVILSISKSQILNNFVEIQIRVGKADNVSGFPNVLKNTRGSTARIFIPEFEYSEKFKVGNKIKIRVRMSAGKIFSRAEFMSI